MATVIKFMLQISPSYRPSCDQILNLPIVQALSKKFFPAELNNELENDDNQSLLRTIRISRNLFSLTERLPKNKYRGRSNDLPRNNSVDSHIGGRHALTLNGSAGNINNKLKQMGVNSQMDMHDSIDNGSPGKYSERLQSPSSSLGRGNFSLLQCVYVLSARSAMDYLCP